MKGKSASEVLQFMAQILIEYLEELSDEDSVADPFLYGERTAYTECLEWVQQWNRAQAAGLDFEIEKRFPL